MESDMLMEMIVGITKIWKAGIITEKQGYEAIGFLFEEEGRAFGIRDGDEKKFYEVMEEDGKRFFNNEDGERVYLVENEEGKLVITPEQYAAMKEESEIATI